MVQPEAQAAQYQEAQETQVVQPEEQVTQPKVQEPQEAQEAPKVPEPQETPVANPENPQASLIIKRPKADLSKHLSLLMESDENYSGSI